LPARLGLKRWPGADTVRGFFHRFQQGTIESFWRPMWLGLLGMASCPSGGFSLDLDSTVFQRAGHQQGAVKGSNPRRPGRPSHHPLLAVLAEVPLVLHGWLRSGNTGAAAFLSEALALLPAGWTRRCVRADSGFFEEGLPSFLEERAPRYLVVARLTSRLKGQAAALAHWQAVEEHYAVGRVARPVVGLVTGTPLCRGARAGAGRQGSGGPQID
jgi:hypothetical protein